MEPSRTEYSAINTSIAIISRITAILMGFVTRVVFIHTLSADYVGVNGLFSNILSVLSLTELGVGTAITFALYKPIAKKDVKKQQQLMQLYGKFYRGTALIVLAVGLLLVPFLDILMKNPPKVDHLIGIYLLYLFNSFFSYLLVYKKTLIEAHQKNYIVLVCQTIFLVLQDLLQIVVLLATHNYIFFLLLYMMCTLLSNVCISLIADRMYPYLKEKCRQRIPKEEKKKIFRNIRAMMMHKVGNIVVNNTDNLLISAYVGVVSVGVYSNYFLLIGSVRQVLDQIFQGITASVGNLGVTEKKERIREVFETAFFIGQWIYAFAAICLNELLNPFVELVFGKNYLFPRAVILILCINFFINGTRQAALTFRDSMGLFWFDRYKALIESGLNIIFSLLLVNKIGILGVFLGTLISELLTSVWVEPYVLYRIKLKASVTGFYLKYLGYVLVVAAGWFLTGLLCSMVGGSTVVRLVCRFFICLTVPNFLWLMIYHRTRECIQIMHRLNMIIPKRKK